MAAETDIDTIKRQEAALIFDAFDEATAFEIGSAIRQRALKENLPIIVDIRTFDRPLFYAAMPGSNGSNPEWARRKFNVVKRFLKSSYRLTLEEQRPDRTFKPGWGIDSADFVLAGGAFPITVKGAGVIGAVTVSGLSEQDDHAVAVDALCVHLGIERKSLALPDGSKR